MLHSDHTMFILIEPSFTEVESNSGSSTVDFYTSSVFLAVN